MAHKPSSLTYSRGRNGGHSLRATGGAAQALFDALTKGVDEPEPPPAEATPAPAPAETPKIQIGPLNV